MAGFRLLPFLLAASFTHVASLSGQLEAPVGAVDAFHRALRSGDSTTALGLLAPDLVVFEGGRVEASRNEYREHHFAADMEFARQTSREVTSRRSGVREGFAWVLTEARTTGTFRGRSVEVIGVETMLLERGPSGWRIVHIHWSSRRDS